MAKNPKSELKEKAKTEVWTSSGGVVVTLHGIPPLLVPRVVGSVQYPSKPTYTIALPGGATETHQHDEKSIETGTDEEKAAWSKYEADLRVANGKRTERLLRAVLLEGVDVNIDEAKLRKWKKRQEIMGIEIPEDAEDLMEVYKETVLIGNVNDMAYIFKRVMELTGVTQEVLDETAATFPDRMESES